MKKVIVLGVGFVGWTIAMDLCHEYQVTVADINAAALESLKAGYPVATIKADLSDQQKIAELVRDQDLVIGAIPGFLAFAMVKTVIMAKKNIVDISFFPEDALALDDLAKQSGVTVVVDCGVAPGMDNVILGYHHRRMEVESFECLVGGLPVVRTWPYYYKAPFSPLDVLEEYTRPARMVENGQVVTKPALSDAEYVEFPGVGTLEAFNTDGLRTLIKTIKVPNMKEKTLRYPGHIEYIRVLRETGFFDTKPIEVKGVSVRPIDVTAKLLFPKWHSNKGDDELTVMRVTVIGKENGKPKRYTYHLLDRYDAKTGASSMARTTGYTCTATARLMLNNQFRRQGVCPPEYLGEDESCFKQLLGYLKERNVIYRCEEA